METEQNYRKFLDNVENKKDVIEKNDINIQESLQPKSNEKKREIEFYSLEEINKEFDLPKEGETSLSNEKMFDPAVKILSGEVKNIDENFFNYTKRYLEKITKPLENESDLQKEIEMNEYLSEEMSEKLKETLAFSENSLLFKQRQKMNINKPENEKPFEVRVLDVTKGEKLSFIDKKNKWQEITKAPSQFALRSKEKTTVYLSAEEAEDIIKNGEKSQFLNSFLHEYRHSQRKFSSENDQMFRIIDESCTNVGMNYQAQRSFIRLMGWTTEDFKFEDIMNAYESDDEKNKKEILQKINDNFGEKGGVLLGGKKSSEHSSEEDGLDNLPIDKVKGNKENEELDFAEAIFSLRAQQDKNWLEKFKNNISDKNVSRGQLEYMKSFGMVPYKKDIEKSSSVYVRSLVDAIDAEIIRRTIKGEAGFYDGFKSKK